ITLGKILLTVYGARLLASAAAYTAELIRQAVATTALAGAQRGWGVTTAASFAEARESLGLLGVAFNVVAAALVGWQIGTYLREQFLEARLAGIALVEALLVAWERIKQGALLAWEIISHGFDVFVENAKRGAALVVHALALVAYGRGELGVGM